MKKFWNQLKPQERRWVAGIGVVVFVILNYLLVWPQVGRWHLNEDRKNKAREKLGVYQKEIAHRPEYERQIRLLEAQGPPVQPEDQSIHFENFYGDRAVENGVAIQTRSPLTTRTNDDFFVEKQAAIQVLTSEEGLVNFLYSLGSSNSLMRVQKMSLRPVEPNRYQLSANLTIVASYQKKTPGPAAPPAAKPAVTPAAKPTPTPSAQPPAVKPLTNMPAGPGRPSGPISRPPTTTTPTNKPGPQMIRRM